MFRLIFDFEDDVRLHISHELTAYLCLYAVSIKREDVSVRLPAGFVAGETDSDGVSCSLIQSDASQRS